MCVVDRADKDSDWVRHLAEACAIADRRSPVAVRSGVEIEVLDTFGRVEPPRFASCVDHLFVSADRLPTPSGPRDLDAVREQIQSGALPAARAVEWLTRAYANVARRQGAVVLARPFDVLPNLGIDPETVHPSFFRWLAGEMRQRDAMIEVSEAHRTPSQSAVDCFLTAGVPVLAASGAASPETVGRYRWCRGLVGGLSSLALAA